MATAGRPFADFARFNAERGEYGDGSVDDHVARQVKAAQRGKAHYTEHMRDNGDVIAVTIRPLPSGGFVQIYVDVTKHRQYILSTEGLTKEFKGFIAVNDVNLKVRKGTIHALIGPNGAGKTTFFNLLTRFLSVTRGKITYNDRDITNLRADAISNLGIVRSFQISSVFPHLTARENVRVALQRKKGMDFHFWRSVRELDALNADADRLLDEVGLLDFTKTRAVELPYGRKRALEIATTMALEPDLMLLDEPTQGMGHEDISRITELIARIAEDRTILMVEHNLSVVSELSQWITVLQRGEILAEGIYADVSRNPDVVEAYMGTAHA